MIYLISIYNQTGRVVLKWPWTLMRKAILVPSKTLLIQLPKTTLRHICHPFIAADRAQAARGGAFFTPRRAMASTVRRDLPVAEIAAWAAKEDVNPHSERRSTYGWVHVSVKAVFGCLIDRLADSGWLPGLSTIVYPVNFTFKASLVGNLAVAQAKVARSCDFLAAAHDTVMLVRWVFFVNLAPK